MASRSDPLTITRSGEPRLLAIQEPSEIKRPWLLLVTDLKTGRQKRQLHASYVEAKGVAKRILGALEDSPRSLDSVDVVVISRSVGYGPPYSKVSDYQLLMQNQRKIYWCPYCRRWRRLLPDPKRGMRRTCQFCHMGEGDFHVTKCNPIYWSAAARFLITHTDGDPT